jgi:hypothetical protein
MIHPNTTTGARPRQRKTLLKNKMLSKHSAVDRRSGKDRRRSSDPNYFLNGGVERRSWKERRFLWYMTE